MSTTGENAFCQNQTKGIYISGNKMLVPDGSIQKGPMVYTTGDTVITGDCEGFLIEKVFDGDDENLFVVTDLSFKQQKTLKKIKGYPCRVPRIGEKIMIKASFRRIITVGEVLYSYRKNRNLYSVLVVSDKKDCWFDCMAQNYWLA